MVIFHSYVKLPEGNYNPRFPTQQAGFHKSLGFFIAPSNYPPEILANWQTNWSLFIATKMFQEVQRKMFQDLATIGKSKTNRTNNNDNADNTY